MSHFVRTTIALLLAGLIEVCAGTTSRAADAAKLALVIGNAKYPTTNSCSTRPPTTRKPSPMS